MTAIAEIEKDFVSPNDFKNFGSAAELFSRLEKEKNCCYDKVEESIVYFIQCSPSS